MKKVIIQDVESSDSGNDGEIIKQLKEKFHTAAERSEMVRVLTVLPKSWSMRRIQAEFGASDYMVRRARELVIQNGILSSPNLKPGHSIAAETCESVCRFYESDEVSRIMPGKKDFVSVRLGKKREHFQKRLLLGNLKELYINCSKTSFQPTPLVFQSLLSFARSTVFWLEQVVLMQFAYAPSTKM